MLVSRHRYFKKISALYAYLYAYLYGIGCSLFIRLSLWDWLQPNATQLLKLMLIIERKIKAIS